VLLFQAKFLEDDLKITGRAEHAAAVEEAGTAAAVIVAITQEHP